jgi:hypothetical protein
MPAQSRFPVATIVVRGVLFLISGTQESEDQEYMRKPFEPEPSSGSFAARNVKLADPLSSGPFFSQQRFSMTRSRSRA